MPYDPETGIITAPVNTDDVVAAIGLNDHRFRELCSSDRINMWSWAKPIRHDSLGPLQIWKTTAKDSDFYAAHFGITIPQSCSPVSMAEHAITYERVRNGVDHARILDFEGYCSKALPSDYVSDYSKEAMFDTPMGLHFSFEGYYRDLNEKDPGLQKYGVDLDPILQNAGFGNMVSLYPMVLVETGGSGGLPTVGSRPAFMHALMCQETGTYRQLGNSAANVRKYYKDWYVDVSPLRDLGIYPGTICRVTVWLNYHDDGFMVPNIGSNAPSVPKVDASTAWREVTGSNYAMRGIAMPLGVGLNIKFSNPSYASFYFAGIFRNLDNNKAMFQFQGSWTDQATPNETIYVRPVASASYWYDNATPSVHNAIAWDEAKPYSVTVNMSGNRSCALNLYTTIDWSTANNKTRTYVVTLGLASTLLGAIDRGQYTYTITP